MMHYAHKIHKLVLINIKIKQKTHIKIYNKIKALNKHKQNNQNSVVINAPIIDIVIVQHLEDIRISIKVKHS